MTLCVVTKWHCLCQPDEGSFCPYYKPDAYVQSLMNAITELRAAAQQSRLDELTHRHKMERVETITEPTLVRLTRIERQYHELLALMRSEIPCCGETPCQWGDHPCERKKVPASPSDKPSAAEAVRRMLLDHDNCGELLQATLDYARAALACAPSAEQRSQAEIEALVEEAYTAEAQGWNIKDGIRAVLRRELMRSHEGATDLQEAINKTIVDIAELPDRTSPDDWPEAMLVTADELGRILRENFEQPCAPSATGDIEARLSNITDEDVRAYVRSLNGMATPWAAGCAAVLVALWSDRGAYRRHLQRMRRSAASTKGNQ